MKGLLFLPPALLLPVIGACVPMTPSGTPPRPAMPHQSGRGPMTMAAPAPSPPPISPTELLDRDCPTFAAALRAAGLAPLLAGHAPVSILAPSEEAWAHLAPGILADLLRPENRASLVALLRFHLAPGRLTIADLRRRAALGPVRVATLAGEPLNMTLAGNTLLFTDATGHRAYAIAEPRVSPGVVLKVNGLLVPQALGPQI
jgi:uncharacterized surface protein with fasciclin (FAS1) repeats